MMLKNNKREEGRAEKEEVVMMNNRFTAPIVQYNPSRSVRSVFIGHRSSPVNYTAHFAIQCYRGDPCSRVG